MKNLSFITFLLLVAFACRKETPLEIPSGTEVVEFTCSNNIQDADEDGVDCGPNCTPCIISSAPCTLVDNRFTESYSTDINTDFFSGDITASTTGPLVIEANNGSRFVKVTFASSNPDVFTSYTVNQYGTLGLNDVRVEYNNGFGYLYTGYSSEVHLNKINGKYEVEFCDVYMNSPSLGGYKVGKGKLTAN